MIFDLTSLSKFKREVLKPDHIVKFTEIEGSDSIPSQSKLWLSLKKYNFRGEKIKEYKQLIYRESEHPRGLKECLATLKKGETSWFRLSGQELGKDTSRQDGLYYHVSLQKHKVPFDNVSEIDQRMSIFKQNKKEANDYFKRGEYKNAIEFYKGCRNSYMNIPKKIDMSKEASSQIQKEVANCNRNICLCVLKGAFTDQYQEAKKTMQGLTQIDEQNPKNWYILAKIQLALRYITSGRESLLKSYNLEQDPAVLELLKSLEKKEVSQKEVYKNVFENMGKFTEQEEKDQLRKARDYKPEPYIQRVAEPEFWVDQDGLFIDQQ